MMSLISVDAQVLVWGVRGAATRGQEEMIPIAQAFFRYVQAHGLRVMIPAPALAELLRGYGEEQRLDVVAALRTAMSIEPFGVEAAVLVAQLKSERDVVSKLKPDLTKNCISFDTMIVATALASEATLLVSNDRGVQALAAGRIRVARVEEFVADPQAFLPPADDTAGEGGA